MATKEEEMQALATVNTKIEEYVIFDENMVFLVRFTHIFLSSSFVAKADVCS